MKLSQAAAGCKGTVTKVEGSHHLLLRLVSIGIVEAAAWKCCKTSRSSRCCSTAGIRSLRWQSRTAPVLSWRKKGAQE